MKTRKIISSILVFLFVFTNLVFSLPTVQPFALMKTPEKVKVTFHYHRYDKDYTDWNLWVWPDKGEGMSYQFNGEDDYGKVATFELSGMAAADKIGFIIRQGEWKSKDIDKDRFITEVAADGTANVWLLQGDENVYYSKDKVNLGGKILTASIDDAKLINVEVNIPFEFDPNSSDNGFSVKVGDKDAAVESVMYTTIDGGLSNKFEITLKDEITFGEPVTVLRKDYEQKTAVYGKIMSSKSFDDKYYYTGTDLGNTFSKDKTNFRVWAPLASEVKLLTYAKAEDTTPSKELDMTKLEKGTWTAEISGNQDGLIYTYKVMNNGNWAEAVDPYARAVTINGNKGVVVDLSTTNPKGWKSNKRVTQKDFLDNVIYELHVRDLSTFKESGIKNAGKFLGLTEKNTKGPKDTTTGLSYIKDLGITHVQLLPIYDYATVDESDPNAGFNWGYDPKNYNAPEGSYSTNATDPKARITELKQAVLAMHDEDLGVIMDVVYNHMYSADESNFNKIVPGYYFRKDANGGWANESGCGNTIASENSMARKFIVDSATYWVKEYNLDGLRFDLMGLIDVKTMNEVRAAIDKIDKTIYIHGEGWDMGNTLTAEEKAKQGNAGLLKGIGFFNDTIRDGIKGSVFEKAEAGWVNGNFKRRIDVLRGIVGAIYYNDSINTWGKDVEPFQSTNYAEAHDNNTLWDKLKLTNPDDSDEVRKQMDFLAASIVFTSQGVPFIQAGQEFLRSKGGDENSYKSPDEVNMLNWASKADNTEALNYYKGLMELRKAHPAFKMPAAAMIRENLKFIDKTPESVIAYTISGNANGDKWNDIVVAFNADKKPQTITLPKDAKWEIVVDGKQAGVKSLKQISGNIYEIPALSTVVMYSGQKAFYNYPLFWAVLCAVVAIAAAGVIVIRKRGLKSSKTTK